MRKHSTLSTLTATFCAAAALAGPVALAQSTSSTSNNPSVTQEQTAQRHRWGMRRAFIQGKVLKQLNLSAEQQAQIKDIRAKHRDAIKPVMQDLQTRRQELRQLAQSGAFDETLVSQKLAEMAPLKAKLMGERVKIRQEIASVLTPEQKAKLVQIKEQIRARIAEHRSHRQG